MWGSQLEGMISTRVLLWDTGPSGAQETGQGTFESSLYKGMNAGWCLSTEPMPGTLSASLPSLRNHCCQYLSFLSYFSAWLLITRALVYQG